jgi:hypothetical protein
MARVRGLLALCLLLGLSVVASGCGSEAKKAEAAPAIASPAGRISANGISSPVYTVNQDADSWHYLVLWRRHGTLYTLSEHVAPPLTGEKVRQYLKRELSSLVLFRPSAS